MNKEFSNQDLMPQSSSVSGTDREHTKEASEPKSTFNENKDDCDFGMQGHLLSQDVDKMEDSPENIVESTGRLPDLKERSSKRAPLYSCMNTDAEPIKKDANVRTDTSNKHTARYCIQM